MSLRYLPDRCTWQLDNNFVNIDALDQVKFLAVMEGLRPYQMVERCLALAVEAYQTYKADGEVTGHGGVDIGVKPLTPREELTPYTPGVHLLVNDNVAWLLREMTEDLPGTDLERNEGLALEWCIITATTMMTAFATDKGVDLQLPDHCDRLTPTYHSNDVGFDF